MDEMRDSEGEACTVYDPRIENSEVRYGVVENIDEEAGWVFVKFDDGIVMRFHFHFVTLRGEEE
jgi:hypothetical protein